MAYLDDYADALREETLREVADNFFGARKGVEDEKELLAGKIAALNDEAQNVLDLAATLHAMLLDEETVYDFYTGLGVRPGPFLRWVEPSRARLAEPTPWGLTFGSRFSRLVLSLYTRLREGVKTYLHGRYVADPRQPARKTLSLNYDTVCQWVDSVNQRIAQVNTNQSPSCVLSFAKGLEPEIMDRERLTEATLGGWACSLDAELAIRPVNVVALGLKFLPELPDPEAVRRWISRFARELCRPRGAEVRAALATLQGQDRGMHAAVAGARGLSRERARRARGES